MMEEIHLLGGNHSSTLSGSGFQLPKNYSQLLNKLEQLALGLESTFANLSIDHKALEISLNAHNGSNGTTLKTDLSEDIFVTSTGQGGLTQHNGRLTSHQLADEINYSRFFSDIWVGVILTLLIVSVIFFICAGFLLHKFQQWKTSYRANPEMDICRHCPGRDFEAESLPSYTIVSGLPTYDDALEEFRKAGIILTPPRVPVIKIFDANGDNKDGQIFNNFDSSINDLTVTSRTSADAISMTSICTCGANNNNNNNNNNISNTSVNSNVITAITPPGTPIPVKHMPGNTQVIELSPDQLAQFSHKRLSLQITFNNSIRRPSRPRVDLYRAANRNNFLRLQAINNAASNPPSPTNSPSCSNANYKNINPFFPNPFPTIHRSTSSGSLINHQQHQQQQQQQQSQQQQQQPQQQQQQQTDCITNNMRLQHRGSLT